MRVNESGVGLALTGQTPILTNPGKVTSLGAGLVGATATIPTLGQVTSTGASAVQSLGQVSDTSDWLIVNITNL